MPHTRKSSPRSAVGLRSLAATSQAKTEKINKAASPSFKQYREKDGLFYFKLVQPQGAVLLQSKGFASPRAAGQAIAQLIDDGATALLALQAHLEPLQDYERSQVLENLSFMLLNRE